MLQALDAAAVRRWAAACVDVLAAHREQIDRINVFPVADADTGSNLLATMRSAFDELLRTAAKRGGHATAALARGALLGARGNSGLVLCQFLRGLALAGDEDVLEITAGGLCQGLEQGARLATEAFAEPVAGTALTVLDAATTAAREAGCDTLTAVTEAAASGAGAALAQTPRQLPVLARAGVVDAGGWGMLLLLKTLAAVAAQRERDMPQAFPVPRAARTATTLRAARESGSPEHEYEVMYLLRGGAPDRVAMLRSELATLGDSVAVVGDGSLWNVHVHCSDIGAAIEAGLAVGRPERITVMRFTDEPDGPPAPPTRLSGRAVVAVAVGEGTAQLFRGEGVAVVTPADGMVGTAAELLSAITGTSAAHVVVLPNSVAGTEPAVAAAAQSRDSGRDVVVVPTASPVQGLAALAVHDPSRRPGDDTVAMAEAAAATRCGELTIAAEEALTWAGRCHPGDVLGLIDGEVVLIGDDLTRAGVELVQRMLSAGGEMVTALVGAQAPDELADVLARTLRRWHPGVELAVYRGGQAASPLLVGVE